MLFLETKYIHLISNRLERFKKQRENQYNFRCTYCGDSQKNKTKARAHFYGGDHEYTYHCHNCSKHLSFQSFLKEFDYALFYQLLKEKLTFDGKWVEREEKKPEVITNIKILDGLKTIDELREGHPVRKYLEKRLIPQKYYSILRYAPKFKTWVNSIKPKSFQNLDYEEPRLIIPFIDGNKLIAIQGRSFDPKQEIKYITITLSDGRKVFGLDTVDLDRDYYVLEGPIDSMFIENSIGIGSSALSDIGNKDNCILVLDNEPMNKEICDKISKAIDQGYRVVIWPTSPDKKEDINSMVIKGQNPFEIISQNIYSGLIAKVKFNEWKRI
jgi:hypothetical protein